MPSDLTVNQVVPYGIQQLIDAYGGSQTLTNSLAAYQTDIDAIRPYVCPQCRKTGKILDADLNTVQCPTCDGYGSTVNLVDVQTIYTEQNP